jgi:DNA-binding XRE family transcriptional regulator
MKKTTSWESYARARAKLGFNHVQMGRLMGVSHTTSMRWETGERGIPQYVSALMYALLKGAMTLEVLESWNEAIGRAIADPPR